MVNWSTVDNRGSMDDGGSVNDWGSVDNRSSMSNRGSVNDWGSVNDRCCMVGGCGVRDGVRVSCGAVVGHLGHVTVDGV